MVTRMKYIGFIGPRMLHVSCLLDVTCFMSFGCYMFLALIICCPFFLTPCFVFHVSPVPGDFLIWGANYI